MGSDMPQWVSVSVTAPASHWPWRRAGGHISALAKVTLTPPALHFDTVNISMSTGCVCFPFKTTQKEAEELTVWDSLESSGIVPTAIEQNISPDTSVAISTETSGFFCLKFK